MLDTYSIGVCALDEAVELAAILIGPVGDPPFAWHKNGSRRAFLQNCKHLIELMLDGRPLTIEIVDEAMRVVGCHALPHRHGD